MPGFLVLCLRWTIYSYDNLPPDQVVVNVQTQLQDDGYYTGEADGHAGPQTRDALGAFQVDHHLEARSFFRQFRLSLLASLVAPDQSKKADCIPHRMDAADFVGINRADRHRRDSKTLPTGDEEHFGFVIKAAGTGEKVGREAAVHHPITALRVGHILPTYPADTATHITINLSPNERHRTQIVHSRSNKETRIASRSRLEKAVDFLRRMLTIGVEEDDKLYLRQRQPVPQPGLYRFTFSAILRMDDDFRATFAGAFGGPVGRTVVDHENMIELDPGALGDFAYMHLLVIGGDNRSNVPTIERASRLRRCALHH